MRTIGYFYGKLIKKVLQGKCITNSTIDKTSKINGGCSVIGSTVGRYSYLGYNCELINCQLGAFCSVASNVFIGGAEHPTGWVSTSPVFQSIPNSGPSERFALLSLPRGKMTIVGNDVWIGHSAIIKAGCRIGDGAVIGAGAVVTKDVPPYAIVGGVPAKVIRMRFSEDVIEQLIDLKWWNFSREQLKTIGPYMNDYSELLGFIRENNGRIV